MDWKEMDKLAQEHADKFAPKPKYEPIAAGLTGVLACQAVMVVFTNLAGLDFEAFSQASSITSVIVFCILFFYFRHGEKEHFKAYEKEMEYLKEQHQKKAA
ncbi:hypothetical protein [Phyllobacterium bourgognense]|uniref:Uncharacterized protein n=1 Tax=Phyllobacterium bourgognense TaxID=314236 RepID=A0A368Z739_9HYPH|nr:hypothetical protein [Phyllobacterium bourgognense]RCW87598.1 hypothetical protein C7476_101364 [Phyllobacterium bourgognense]